MRFILLGDVHGYYDEMVYILRNVDHDFAIQVGDLADDTQIDRACEILKPYRNTVFAIRGNHDTEKCPVTWLNTSVRINQVTVAGLSGIYSPKRFGVAKTTIKYYTYRDMAELAMNQRADILVAHEPFHGMGVTTKYGNTDVGIPHLTTMVELLQPQIYVCGHHHYPRCGLYKNRVYYFSLPYVTRGFATVSMEGGEVTEAVLYNDLPVTDGTQPANHEVLSK